MDPFKTATIKDVWERIHESDILQSDACEGAETKAVYVEPGHRTDRCYHAHVQWWDERGFLKPKLVQGKGPGGIVRQYTTEQLTVIERALILKRAGVREHLDRLFPIAKRIKMTPRRLGKLVAEIKALGLRLHC